MKSDSCGTVQAAAELDGAITVEVNFLGCVTPADVAERIERAYSAHLDGSLRRWFAAVLRTLHPTVRVAGVELTPQIGTPGLLDRLALPKRVQVVSELVIAKDRALCVADDVRTA